MGYLRAKISIRMPKIGWNLKYHGSFLHGTGETEWAMKFYWHFLLSVEFYHTPMLYLKTYTKYCWWNLQPLSLVEAQVYPSRGQFFLCKTSLFLPIVVAWVPCGCWIILSLLEIFGLAGNIPTCHRNHLESFNPPYSCRSISSMLVGQIRNFNGIHGYAAVATWCRPTYPITFRWHTTIDQVHRYDVPLWHFHLQFGANFFAAMVKSTLW